MGTPNMTVYSLGANPLCRKWKGSGQMCIVPLSLRNAILEILIALISKHIGHTISFVAN